MYGFSGLNAWVHMLVDPAQSERWKRCLRSPLRSSLRAVIGQQWFQLACMMKCHHVVVAANMGIPNENLGHAGTLGECNHFSRSAEFTLIMISVQV